MCRSSSVSTFVTWGLPVSLLHIYGGCLVLLELERVDALDRSHIDEELPLQRADNVLPRHARAAMAAKLRRQDLLTLSRGAPRWCRLTLSRSALDEYSTRRPSSRTTRKLPSGGATQR